MSNAFRLGLETGEDNVSRALQGHYGSVSTALGYRPAISPRDLHLSRLTPQARSWSRIGGIMSTLSLFLYPLDDPHPNKTSDVPRSVCVSRWPAGKPQCLVPMKPVAVRLDSEIPLHREFNLVPNEKCFDEFLCCLLRMEADVFIVFKIALEQDLRCSQVLPSLV
jgi:hypothetical protein